MSKEIVGWFMLAIPLSITLLAICYQMGGVIGVFVAIIFATYVYFAVSLLRG